MKTNLILSLVTATVFSLIAFIFSEVIPDLAYINHTFLRVFITFLAGIIGFSVFPDIARSITVWIASLVNTLTVKVSSEVMTQIIRLPKQNSMHVPYTHSAPLGGVTVNQPLILDTSAIIDGRILDIAKANFLFGTVLVPTYVLTELQQVADSSDFLKRSRGRRGFEIIDELKKIKGIRIEVWDKDIAGKTVDDKILKLAKSLNGRIITTDFNLNRVASVSGVSVLNINDLANAVKTVAIPGENMKVKVIHLGKDTKQGVGYLPDGTMIVVEEGADLIGKEVKVEVSRILQVSAGKMIFAKKLS